MHIFIIVAGLLGIAWLGVIFDSFRRVLLGAGIAIAVCLIMLFVKQ